MSMISPPSKPRLWQRLRTWFLTGLVVVAPISITIYLARWFIELVDSWFRPLVPTAGLKVYIPGLGIFLALVLLTVIGALTANFLGRSIVSFAERQVNRMPVVRNIYKALKQIFETVFSQSASSFQQVGLIEYPRKGLYALVFVTTPTRGEIRHRLDQKTVNVFLPTTPNPTSGFLLFVPADDIQILDMSVEEAAKMVISAGLVTPGFSAGVAESLKDQPERG